MAAVKKTAEFKFEQKDKLRQNSPKLRLCQRNRGLFSKKSTP
jgi:hypothetical protein